jgi:BolA protein
MEFPIRKAMYEKLIAKFKPLHMELQNESKMHGLPESAEKHFRLILVSSAMENLSRIDRHRVVNDVLAHELKTHVHALTVQAFTPDEWDKKQSAAFASPACLGGGKHERS